MCDGVGNGVVMVMVCRVSGRENVGCSAKFMCLSSCCIMKRYCYDTDDDSSSNSSSDTVVE